MRTTIDRAGRIVVPKALREALNLEGGTVIEIWLRSGRLEVEPVATPMQLERRGDRLVATTEEPLPGLGVEDVRAVIESQRRLIAVDTSVTVAAFGPWHELHEPASAVVSRGPAVPALVQGLID